MEEKSNLSCGNKKSFPLLQNKYSFFKWHVLFQDTLASEIYQNSPTSRGLKISTLAWSFQNLHIGIPAIWIKKGAINIFQSSHLLDVHLCF